MYRRQLTVRSVVSCAAVDAQESVNFPWLHGRIARRAAEATLQRFGASEGLFLVRESTSVRMCADAEHHDAHYTGADNECPPNWQMLSCLFMLYVYVV